MILCRRFFIPLNGQKYIFRYPSSISIHTSQVILSIPIALIRRFQMPFVCFLVISFHPFRRLIHPSYPILSVDISGICSYQIILQRFLIIFLFIIFIRLIHVILDFCLGQRCLWIRQFCQFILGILIPLIRSLTIPTDRLIHVLLNTSSQFIHQSQIILSIHVPLLCRLSEPFHSFRNIHIYT